MEGRAQPCLQHCQQSMVLVDDREVEHRQVLSEGASLNSHPQDEGRGDVPLDPNLRGETF